MPHEQSKLAGVDRPQPDEAWSGTAARRDTNPPTHDDALGAAAPLPKAAPGLHESGVYEPLVGPS